MPSIFRSENVEYCQLVISTEYAYDILRTTGELGYLQLIDRNTDIPSFNKKFTQNIIWADEMERKLRFFEEELKKEKLVPIENGFDSSPAPDQNKFVTLENDIDSLTSQVVQSNEHMTQLRKTYNDLVEYRHVMRNAKKALKDENYTSASGQDSTQRNISMIYGVIPREQINGFEQFLWRACRGNILLRQVEIEDDVKDIITGEKIPKCVFVIILQGDQSLANVHSVCEAFHASIYPYSDSPQEQQEINVNLLARIKDTETIINQTSDQRKIYHLQICKNYIAWKTSILKIKAIYAALNMFSYDTGSKSLVTDCWCPSVYINKVKDSFKIVKENTANLPAILNIVPTKRSPPTFFQLNKVTEAFQNLVDAYGVGKYKEVNPALYMVITFPFLFGVMFGDFGHGILLTIAALYICIFEKSFAKYKNDDMFGVIYGGRYIILLMGLFSIYTGIIYNDIFSKSVSVYPSGWLLPSRTTTNLTVSDLKLMLATNNLSAVTLDPKIFAKPEPYPFGVDPLWMFAQNKISYSNSFKMKTSIILGVIQMTFGIILSAFNHSYYGHYNDIYMEFIPQILFFLCFFGYLLIMIFYKWIFVNAFSEAQPSLLLMLLGMVLNFSKPIDKADQFYDHQSTVESVLVVVAFICIPWMLLVKPISLVIKKHLAPKIRKSHMNLIKGDATSMDHHRLVTRDSEDQDPTESPQQNTEDEESNLGEMFILQVIETIEFVLGCISNTASYLRLWALSLAHAQLSDVLWSMLLRMGLTSANYSGSILIYILFFVFMVLTIGILVVMEGLSAFLHALRLHWVEFQNKFYVGSGLPFMPFSLKNILSQNSA